jgi:hypothetical protein
MDPGGFGRNSQIDGTHGQPSSLDMRRALARALLIRSLGRAALACLKEFVCAAMPTF